MISLFKHYGADWEQDRGTVHEDMEQIETVLNAMERGVTDDGIIDPNAITGDKDDIPSYVANTGRRGVPKWDKVDLVDGVKARLQYAHLKATTAISVLLGRGSAAGAGDYQQITLGAGLAMTGTVLSTSGGGTGTVTQVDTDDTYVSGGPIIATGTISATTRTRSAVNSSLHSLCGGL